MQTLSLTVYGAVEKCASCVHLPNSKETLEWLDAAVTRKFPQITIEFHYVDIDSPCTDEMHMKFIRAIQDETYFYPLVVMNGDIVAEGNPRLKDIFEKVEQWKQTNFAE